MDFRLVRDYTIPRKPTDLQAGDAIAHTTQGLRFELMQNRIQPTTLPAGTEGEFREWSRWKDVIYVYFHCLQDNRSEGNIQPIPWEYLQVCDHENLGVGWHQVTLELLAKHYDGFVWQRNEHRRWLVEGLLGIRRIFGKGPIPIDRLGMSEGMYKALARDGKLVAYEYAPGDLNTGRYGTLAFTGYTEAGQRFLEENEGILHASEEEYSTSLDAGKKKVATT